MHASGETHLPADSVLRAGEQGLSNLVSDWTQQIIVPTDSSQDPGTVYPLPGNLDYEDAPATSGSPKKKSSSKVPSPRGSASGDTSGDSATNATLIGGVVGGLAGLLALLGGMLLTYGLTAHVHD